MFWRIFLALLAGLSGQSIASRAQSVEGPNIVIPQSRVVCSACPGPAPVSISSITVNVAVHQQLAVTTMEIALRNNSPVPQETQMLIPLPDAATVRSFGYDGVNKEPNAKILPRAEAESIYRSIVNRMRDPALLEFAGYNLARSSVFPVPPRSTQIVTLIYENLLLADGNRIDYVIPRSESFASQSIPWKINLDIDAGKGISTAYSPTHPINTSRSGRTRMSISVGSESRLDPGPFRISWLLDSSGVNATFLAYPDPSIGGGYFLMLAASPTGEASKESPVKREVTLVIDRSGSMQGEKIEQVRAAALQVINGLSDGEAFNIIDYSDSVSSFAPKPVIRNRSNLDEARDYIRNIRAGGGTNIRDALAEALREPPVAKTLPIILFLTDGLPTTGETRESAIRDCVKTGNRYNRRIFTFGVGYDVNAPLLNALASDARGAVTFVLPKEDVEVKVGQVFRRLSGPVLSDPHLTVLGPKGEPETRLVRDLLPNRLNDVFEGDQILLLGQYHGTSPMTFSLAGSYRGESRTFDFKFDPESATARNSYVPRLWASRKIAFLIDQIRQMGADKPRGSGADPAVRELIDEIVALSTTYGILTEYTAFLAVDGANTGAPIPMANRVSSEMLPKLELRSGASGTVQEMNISAQKSQDVVNRANVFLDKDLKKVETTSVQQIGDRTFFHQNNQWVEANVLKRPDAKPGREIAFGTPEYDQVVERLVREGRQGILALGREIVLELDGKVVLLK